MKHLVYLLLLSQFIFPQDNNYDGIFENNIGYNIFIKLNDYKKAKEILEKFLK